MNLRLYNTLTRTKEDFVPLDAKNVRMYVCGPTVYDFAHIGNARPVIVFDVLFRLLRHRYGGANVRYVRNITDVDDKINARAADTGISILDLTTQTTKQFQEDVKKLKCLPPTREPRATEYIQQMITMVERLITAGHAYVAGEHVLYDVSSKHDYGKLARRSLDEMIAGSRVEVAPYKKNPMDFILWKPSERKLPGWHSPWGRGRPGWHIECSAMSESLLGETFDIHGGGIDLAFPHHENEIAQSEGAHHGHQLACVWMHNGFLQVEGEKMSKSLGNFYTIRDLLAQHSGDVIRFAMLQTHYRQPIDWTDTLVQQSRARLANWKSFAAERLHNKYDKVLFNEALLSLCDDLNTPEFFGLVDRIVRRSDATDEDRATVNRFLTLLGFVGKKSQITQLADDLTAILTRLTEFSSSDWNKVSSDIHAFRSINLGGKPGARLVAAMAATQDFTNKLNEDFNNLSLTEPVQLLKSEILKKTRLAAGEEIARAIAARNEARKAKNFKESDRIRDELLAKGIVLKDGPAGTTWEVKR